MESLTREQKRIIDPEYEETIIFLMEKIKKYHGKYNTKEFKEWLTSALMLEIDIQKDNTYDEATLSKIDKIEFAQKIINFNIYGNIRKFLENYDHTLTFPGRGYNGNDYNYPVWHDRFVPGDPNIPRGDSDKIQVLEMPSTESKSIITITGPIERSKKIRQLQIDKMILELYKQSKEKPKTNFESITDYHYNMDLASKIQILNDWIIRCKGDYIGNPHKFPRTRILASVDEESQKINDYTDKLYKALENEYGKFNKMVRHEESSGKIAVDTKGIITETYPIKETPVSTWQKRITHY